ncbi:MAG: 5-formyltetrahydrofolate cyclo-ligase [Clostridia bacterium]|nr:5-formyltetrahydrofolate cyclo-ligase [Clostridia bacterium]
MNKEQLRKHYKAMRREITSKTQKSESICRQVKSLPDWRTAAVVGLYASLPDEVDTAPLISAAIQAGKTVCLPKVNGKEMQFYQIAPDCAYTAGAFGIREPCSDILIDKDRIDIMIVPLLAADEAHYRLGFGGGYYDRYLRDYSGTSIGIGFCEQLSPTPLPHEAHDIALEFLITDK